MLKSKISLFVLMFIFTVFPVPPASAETCFPLSNPVIVLKKSSVPTATFRPYMNLIRKLMSSYGKKNIYYYRIGSVLTYLVVFPVLSFNFPSNSVIMLENFISADTLFAKISHLQIIG